MPGPNRVVEIGDFPFESITSGVRFLRKTFGVVFVRNRLQFQVAVEGAKELAVETHFVVAEGLLPFPFKVPDADLTPVGCCHFAYEQMLDLSLRFEGFVEPADEVVEAV